MLRVLGMGGDASGKKMEMELGEQTWESAT